MSKIVHFEIPVDDVERAGRFYRDVLGWEISGYGDYPYWLVRGGPDDEPGANGALTARDELHRTPVVIAGVADIDKTLKLVEAAGGRLAQEKLPVQGMGWAAYVVDPEGNTIGLFQIDPGAA